MKTSEQLRTLLAEAVRQAGSALRYARQHKLSYSQLTTSLRGASISDKVAKTLGYRRKVVYVKES